MSLSRIEVITGMSKFSSLKAALSKAGVRGMTVMQVLGCGVEKGTREYEVMSLKRWNCFQNSRSILLWKRSV